MKFNTAIWVRDGVNVTPIATLEDAAQFLEALPDEARGSFGYVASKSIRAAMERKGSLEQAKTTFLDFCDHADLLLTETMIPGREANRDDGSSV